MLEDFVASAGWLGSHAQSTGRVGAIGFCFGGGIVNQLAVRIPDLGAGAPFTDGSRAPEDNRQDQGAADAALRRNDEA